MSPFPLAWDGGFRDGFVMISGYRCGWFQAHVWVASERRVETWCGFAYTFFVESGESSKPEIGLALWKDEQKWPFCPEPGCVDLAGAKRHHGTDVKLH